MPAAPIRDLSVGAGHYSDQSFWWRHEAYHINAVLRYEIVRPLVSKYILDGESQWTARLPAHAWNSADPLLTEISSEAFRESDRQEKAMVERMKEIKKTASSLSAWFWKRMARRSGVPLV
jgi:hypothetical protein